MNRAGLLLLVLLIAQVGILVFQNLGADAAGSVNVSARLAEVGHFNIDEVRVENGRGDSATLLRENGRWWLPELDNLPADGERVEALLQSLTEEDPGWAVADTLPARQRFQVAPYHFRRKLTLMAHGQKISKVYLGNSPSFRKVHARNSDATAIYSVHLNLFDVPPLDGGWLDTGLLRVRAPLRIVADGYSLDRSSGDWRLDGDQTPDPNELRALLDSLKTLQVEGVADAGQREQVGQLEAELILQVEGLSGETTLSLYQHQQEQFLRSSRHGPLFRISGYTFDQLTGIDSMMLAGAEDNYEGK